MTTRWVALTMALCACDCFFGPETLTYAGLPSPWATDVLVSVVEERCGALRGEIEWRSDPVECSYDGGLCSGIISYGACAFHTQVWWREGVTDTALAHELGHWCLRTGSEEEANRFASEINEETLRRASEPR